ncbi:MAG: type II secretion system protein [Candidatus Komeilibacteria bacterium]|nr:type II secretion system protein [Candidatus Komeilibacteria bacterium]
MNIQSAGYAHSRLRGFTLIELLVVISIIGLLSTLAVVSLNNARAKARDARRLSDLKAIQTAIEIYRDDNNDYVPNLAVNNKWVDTIAGMNSGTDIYLPAGAPVDPDPTRAVGQPNEAKSYVYCVSTDLTFYLMHANLEVSPPASGLSGALNPVTYPGGSCVNVAGSVDPATVICDGNLNFCLGRL